MPPGLAAEVTGLRDGGEAGGDPLQLLALRRPGGHVALDPVVQAVDADVRSGVGQGLSGDLVRHGPES